MQGLKLVRAEALLEPALRSLLLVNLAGDRKRITVEERAICVPLVDLSLHPFYVLSDLIEAGEKYGTCMAALVPYVWQGRKCHLRAAAVTLLDGPLLAVPFGFFTRAN